MNRRTVIKSALTAAATGFAGCTGILRSVPALAVVVPTSPAPNSPIFTQTLYIAKSASVVWQAITDKDIVTKYYMCPLADIDPSPGGQIRYGSGKKTYIKGVVMKASPNKTLEHTFQMSNHPEDVLTTVTYEISDMGDICKLTLTHSGFTFENGTYQDISFGWPWILSRLKTLLETGHVMKMPDNM